MKVLLTSLFLCFNVFALQLDTAKSSFSWEGKKVTGKHWGKISVKEANLKGKEGIESGTIVMDLNSITVDDLSGETADKFLGHIKSGDFFEVEKYPTAKLEIKEVKGNKLMGELSIKDKTQKVEIPFTKNGNTYEGTFTFDRTKFNMVYGSKDFFKSLGDKAIYNDVQLKFKVVAQ